jgi:PknH-like extracellular domain
MRRHAAAMLALGLFLTACTGGAGGAAGTSRTTAALIPASALEGALVSTGDINSIMGTNGMTVTDVLNDMGDHSILLPNVNCLGIWEVGEKRIYRDSGWTAMRGQVLRQPDTENYDFLVIQAVVLFPSPDAAKGFFNASGDRWSKCTNHKVNMSVNGAHTTWFFGDLKRTDSELTMPVTRGAVERSCQRALSVINNVAIDVAACSAAASDQAGRMVDKIRSKIPA